MRKHTVRSAILAALALAIAAGLEIQSRPAGAQGTSNIGLLPGVGYATTGSLGGGLLAAGACSSTTIAVNGAAVGMVVQATPNDDPGAGYYTEQFVSSANNVTVRVCVPVLGTPAATTYNVRLYP